jgi:hypothetical protein
MNSSIFRSAAWLIRADLDGQQLNEVSLQRAPSGPHDSRCNGLAQPSRRGPGWECGGLVAPTRNHTNASGFQRANPRAHYGRGLHHQELQLGCDFLPGGRRKAGRRHARAEYGYSNAVALEFAMKRLPSRSTYAFEAE